MSTRTLLPPVHHHASHRRLLHREPRPRGRAKVDAIIVPAARDVSGLEPAIQLAQELRCPLVALCSHKADATTLRERSWKLDVPVIAVDVRESADLPRALTTTMLADSPFARRTDTAMKRNLGLALTWMTGWQRVLSLDDDISGVDAAAVEHAAGLLPTYGAVGLENTGYTDNSVVCHANRDTGAEQGTFIGGGAMLFPGARATSFFPDIYNEDWFFLLDDRQLVDVAVHGSFAQAQFDPYPNPSRAGQEEFGDCLAEGLFSLLDDGQTLAHADLQFWRSFIVERRRLIEEILKRLPSAQLSSFRREQMAAALRAARHSLLNIEPSMCVAYLEAWRHDRDRWRRYIGRLPRSISVDQALGILGLKI